MSAPALDLGESQFPFQRLLGAMRQGNRALWFSSLAMALGALVCFALMLVDDRLFNGINVWDKPAKFFLSLAVQFGTVSFALGLLPESLRGARGNRFAVWAMVAAGWLEVLYIAFRAGRAEASHFSTDSALAQVLYSIMGVGALILTLTALFIGFRVWQQRHTGLLVEATGLGLMLGMVLGTGAGMYLGAQTSHWVGGEMSDAHGLGLLAWSTSGGDLRVAHFVGLHAAQMVPLAALSGSRRVVCLAALVIVAVTVFTFAQAVLGLPLFKA
jgi:hypothetical protein